MDYCVTGKGKISDSVSGGIEFNLCDSGQFDSDGNYYVDGIARFRAVETKVDFSRRPWFAYHIPAGLRDGERVLIGYNTAARYDEWEAGDWQLDMIDWEKPMDIMWERADEIIYKCSPEDCEQ